MLYILSGPDDFSLNQALDEIKKGLGDQSSLAANTTAFDGQVTPDQLKATVAAVPFLAEKRLVIIRGLLGRFEPKDRASRRQKTTRVTGQPDEFKAFSACIGQRPESTVIVLVESRVTNNNPLFRELARQATVKSFALIKSDDLRLWIRRRVTDEGSSISPQAADLLAKLLGSNLWVMASEINKLVLFATGRRIEEGDVKMVVSHAQETSVFTMVDAIIELKVELAQQLLEQLIQKGATPVSLLFLLSRQARLIIIARELKSQGKSETEIQNKLGLAEFALRKTLEQASKYSLPRLKQVYRQLLEADLAIKTGRYDGELALNILVAELCQRGTQRSPPQSGIKYVPGSRM